MAKKQSKLRDAIDVVFAPSDYLTMDGAPVGRSRLSQLFKNLAKPENLTLVAAVPLSLSLDVVHAIHMAFAPLFMMPGLYYGYKMIEKEAFEDNYYDTTGQTKSVVEPDKANAILLLSISGGLLSGGMTALATGAFVDNAIRDNGMTFREVSAGMLMLLPFIVQNFGHFWRSKQVLDGNWSLIEGVPPEKETETQLELQPAT